MMTLGPLAVNCPELEREIVTALVLNYKSLGVPIRQLIAVVENVARLRCPGKTVGRYVLPMLSFVLNEFLKQELPLEDFPHRLLNCDSAAAFVRRFEHLVVPLLLWRAPRPESLAALKAVLGVERSHVLVERNFVRILAYYLPEVTHSKEKLNKVEQKANELSKMMLKRLGEDRYYELIQARFPQILSEVYKQIYDPDHVRKSLGFESAALATRPNPPHTTVAKLDRLHDYFLASFPHSSQRPLFAYLTQEILPHCLQDITLKLTDVLRDRTSGADLKIRALHGLFLFLQRVRSEAEHLQRQLPFLVWFITNSLLLVLRREGDGSDDVIRAALVVTKSAVSLAVEEGVAVAFGRVLAPLKTALTERMMAAKQKGGR